jgi:acetylglutamate kinase
VEVVEMVLSGTINKHIVAAITEAVGLAVGLSGKDGHMIIAIKLHRTVRDPDSNIERVLDLGLVGEPETIRPEVLDRFRTSDIIPVIAPIGISREGETLNINADTAAGAIAGAIGGKRLIMLTDVVGVLDDQGVLIPDLTVSQAKMLISKGVVQGGMIPKIETCIAAVENGVAGAVIVDGRVPHALLLEIFTEHGAGTIIRPD